MTAALRGVRGPGAAALALLGLTGCGGPPPASPAPRSEVRPAAETEVAPVPAPMAAPPAEPDPAAFDAPLPPGAVAIEVCSLDAVLGVESEGPAIGPIARRGDGVVVVAMDEQLAELAPVPGRACRFSVTVTPRPGLAGARAALAADRADPHTVWLAEGTSVVRLAGARDGGPGLAAEALHSSGIDDIGLAAHPAGGVWVRLAGRMQWFGAPDGSRPPPLPAGLAPRAVLADGTLLAEDGESLVRLAPDGARTRLGPGAPLVRTGDDVLVLAAPRASEALRTLGLDGTPLRTLAPAETVDLALGLMHSADASTTLTGLSELADGAGYVALETVRSGVRLAVVVRVRGL